MHATRIGIVATFAAALSASACSNRRPCDGFENVTIEVYVSAIRADAIVTFTLNGEPLPGACSNAQVMSANFTAPLTSATENASIECGLEVLTSGTLVISADGYASASFAVSVEPDESNSECTVVVSPGAIFVSLAPS